MLGAQTSQQLRQRTELCSSSQPQELLVQLKLRLTVSQGLRSEGKTNMHIHSARCAQELPLFPSTKSQAKTFSGAQGEPNSPVGEPG